jgi:hypothetical protein
MQTSTERLFTEARTQNGYRPQPVPDETLHALYDLLKWGPTSANSSPARFLFVRSDEAKARLIACLNPGNVHKVREAPVTAIIGMDMAFHDRLPFLFPHTDARSWFAGDEAKIAETAFRNSSLQGGYLILAARARPGLRADERLRRREDGRRVLDRHERKDEFHLRARCGRPGQGARAQPAPAVRAGVPPALKVAQGVMRSRVVRLPTASIDSLRTKDWPGTSQ